jgi:LPXTG-motif cell wall-anchored protein
LFALKQPEDSYMRLDKIVLCALATSGIFPVAAQTWDKVTTVTINEPIEVPGAKVLQPGTYTFKLLDIGQGDNRHTVQILNKDQTQVFATIEAIPNMRLRPAEKTVLLFYEMPKGQPEALRAWFYPGDNMGQEFAYPKARAAELSQSSTEQVPVASASDRAEPAQPEPTPTQVSTTQPQAPEPAVAETSVSAGNSPPEPAPSSVASADSSNATIVAQSDPAQNAPQSNSEEPSSTPQELPQTGSDIPLAGLIGLTCLAAAGVLRFAPLSR